VPVAIKFCGLTRAVDAEAAVRLGAAYAGVIFAGGPRLVDARRAREILSPTAGTTVTRVGVFGDQSVNEIEDLVHELALGVAQLHGDRDAGAVARIASALDCDSWAVVRIAGDTLPDDMFGLAHAADGLVLDSRVPGMLGGTGTTFDWNAVRERIGGVRRGCRLILAGGLTPENVADGVRLLQPDVVDVSSGVESTPGEKDHARMLAFARAVRHDPDDS
jgi:phosphoribosylanthranilate isomerase